MKKIICILTLVCLLTLLSACSKESGNVSADLSKYSPQKLVETYYDYLSDRNFEAAKLCLSDEYLKTVEKSSDSDFDNLQKLKDIKVSKEAKIKLYGKNFDEVQVVADYYAEYKQNAGAQNGLQHRFIYVGKKTEDSPWKIISIGTGP